MIQKALSRRQKRQVSPVASTGARRIGGSASRLSWMISTRMPCISISGQIPVAATRSDCQSMRAMRESESIGRPMRNNMATGA